MALDPEIFDTLIDTIRRFVRERLRPLEGDVEAADAIPDAVIEEMKGSACSACRSPRNMAGSG